MRLVSWNAARRVNRWSERIAALESLEVDVLALQEVTPSNIPAYRRDLPGLGLPYIVDSFELAAQPDLLTGPRRYGELIAARFPLTPLDPSEFAVPWSERVLSAIVHTTTCTIELHTTHVPPGVSHDWLKIEHFEGLFARLACDSERPRILCGDFNSPKAELPDGTTLTWGRPPGRWDAGERSVLVGLAAYDLPDVFRELHGFERQEFSWCWHGRGREVGRRFDHVFASRRLQAHVCRYVHEVRQDRLSDHSAILVDFAQ